MHAVVSKIPDVILSHDNDDADDEDDDDDDDDVDDDDYDDDELPSFLVWVLLLERGRAGPDHSKAFHHQLPQLLQHHHHHHHHHHRWYFLRNWSNLNLNYKLLIGILAGW